MGQNITFEWSVVTGPQLWNLTHYLFYTSYPVHRTGVPVSVYIDIDVYTHRHTIFAHLIILDWSIYVLTFILECWLI